MKTALIIAYYFPPMAGAGVLKSLKFVKYLRDFGYNPVVLTVNPAYTRNLKDKSLYADIPPDIPVYRTLTFDWKWIFKLLWGIKLNMFVVWLQRNVLLPDPELTWVPFAVKQLDKIIAHHQIDIIYVSGSPFSSYRIGLQAKKKYGIPFVIDYRDEWTSNPTRLASDYPAKSLRIELKAEERILRESAAVVYTIPHYMQVNFEQKYPFLKDKLQRDISNGFDESDFCNLAENYVRKTASMRIVYTGTFYDRRQPEFLWKALSELIQEKKIDADSMTFELIGKNKPSFVLGESNNDQEIRKLIKFSPNLPHQNALFQLSSADLLLLYIVPGPNSRAELTGKIFEYMRLYKPILAIIPPDGIAAEILNISHTGYIYDSSSIDAIKQGLLHVLDLWRNKKLFVEPDKEFISTFNRSNLTRKLAELFDEVLKK